MYLYFRKALFKKSSKTIQLFRLSSTSFEKSSNYGNSIDIPKRIKRSSTDILKVCIFINIVLILIDYID